MTHSRGPDPAPRVGRALPAKWQLAVAAAVAFLLYAIFAPVADWLGLRSRPEPAPAQLKGEAAANRLGAIEAEFIEALRALAASADDAKRKRAEKLARDYVQLRDAAREKASREESEVAKRERKQKEDEAYSRAWAKFSEMLADSRVTNAAIVEHLVRNLSALPGGGVETAVSRLIGRTEEQSGAEREMAVLAREIETLVMELPRQAGAGGDAYQARLRIRERIEAYHRARQNLAVPEDRSGERELRAIELMPFESGARVLLRNLAKAHQGALVSALGNLRLDWVMGTAAAADGPLFPEPPRIKDHMFGGAAQQQKEQALLRRKWDLRTAIDTIYRDCREPYRERYLGYLKVLVAQFLAMGRVVESVPVTEYYPEFLLGPGATPNERLVGAGEILHAGFFTRATEAKIAGLAEALIGRECPAERFAYSGPRPGKIPSLSTFGVVPRDVPTLPAERVAAEAARALDLALQHCEPRARHVYAGHIVKFVARAMAVKPRRRGSAPEDAAIAAQLRAASRAEIAAGLRRAVLLPDISEELAAAAQTAAGRLFQEQCPVSPYPTQLEAYRAIEAASAKEAAERAAARK